MTTPSLNIEPLALPAVGSHHDDLWSTLCDLGDAHDDGWVLVGGQMVLLHVLQADAAPTRVSDDFDAVVDVRARPPVLHDFLATLASRGFTAAGVSPDEHAHRSSGAPSTSTYSLLKVLVDAPISARSEALRRSKHPRAHRR